MWFNESMAPNFVTHDLNTRRRDVWDAELAESILERGMVTGVAVEPWMQISDKLSFPLRAITWGSRCRGFYKAHSDNHVFVLFVKIVWCILIV